MPFTQLLLGSEHTFVTETVRDKVQEAAGLDRAVAELTALNAGPIPTAQIQVQIDRITNEENTYIKFRIDAVTNITDLLTAKNAQLDTDFPGNAPHAIWYRPAFPFAGIDPTDWQINEVGTGSITLATPPFDLEDTFASFPSPNGLAGRLLLMTSGAETGNTFLISSNTATTITLAVSIGGILAGDSYSVPGGGPIAYSFAPSVNFNDVPTSTDIARHQTRFTVYNTIITDPMWGTTAILAAMSVANLTAGFALGLSIALARQYNFEYRAEDFDIDFEAAPPP